LARLHALGEKAKLAEHVEGAMRHLLFWSIPATVLAIVLRADLVRVILGSGAFDWSATRLTAAALALFVTSLVGQNLTLLIARTYYAGGNSKKPLYYGLVDIVVAIGSALLLVSLFHSSTTVRLFIEALLRVADIPGTTVLMLALGYALGSTLEAVVGYIFFVRDFKIPQAHIRRLAFQSFGASVIGGAGAYLGLVVCGYIFNINTTVGVFLTCLIAGVVGVVITALMLALLKNSELSEVYASLRLKLSSASRVAVEPTDIES
jgi:putative peptidoglycan lipid II flippase